MFLLASTISGEGLNAPANAMRERRGKRNGKHRAAGTEATASGDSPPPPLSHVDETAHDGAAMATQPSLSKNR